MPVGLLVVRGLVPRIHVFLSTAGKDVDGRAFAAPKRLRPRRRANPGHDDEEISVPTAGSHEPRNIEIIDRTPARAYSCRRTRRAPAGKRSAQARSIKVCTP